MYYDLFLIFLRGLMILKTGDGSAGQVKWHTFVPTEIMGWVPTHVVVKA